jgi:arabinose-5-phosphate isomerase
MRSGSEIPRVAPDARLRAVIAEMTAKTFGMTTVVENDRLVGVVSDGDLRRLLERVDNPLDILARDIMTRDPRCIGPDVLALRALEIMEAPPRAVTWLVVRGADDAVLGLLRLHDILSMRR